MESPVNDSTRSQRALDNLLHVFETTLADVPFPDVGAKALREAQDVLIDKADAVAAAEAALADARAAEDEAKKEFERIGKRALAYAQVFADGQEPLATRLGEIARDLAGQPRAAEQTADAPRKRGRPRKVDTTLFEQANQSSRDVSTETEADADEEAA